MYSVGVKVYTDFFYFYYIVFMCFWFGGHSGGVTPGLVSIPEVKSSCVFGCTVGLRLWEPFDAAGHPFYKLQIFKISKILN